MDRRAVPEVEGVHFTALKGACAKASNAALALYEDYLGKYAQDDPEVVSGKLSEIDEKGTRLALEFFTKQTRGFPQEVVHKARDDLRSGMTGKRVRFGGRSVMVDGVCCECGSE